MSLFDFDFSKEITDEDIERTTKEIALLFKERGNPRFIRSNHTNLNPNLTFEKVVVPDNIRMMLPTLHEKGVLTLKDGSFSLKDEYRDWHTVGEVAEMFREACAEYLESGGHAYGLNSVSTGFSLGYKFSTHDEYLLFLEEMRKEKRYIVKELGLKHFLEVPESRGHRMNCFDSKKQRKLRKLLAEIILHETNPDVVEDFFKKYGIYLGKTEYNRNASWIDHDKVPALEIANIMPTYFECVCIAEATDTKTIELVLDYCGRAWKGSHQEEDLILIDEYGTRKKYYPSTDLKKSFEELEDMDHQPPSMDLFELPNNEIDELLNLVEV